MTRHAATPRLPCFLASASEAAEVRSHAPIPTWFKVGGGAERMVVVRDVAQLATELERDPGARVLGDGANLLVDDAGVRGTVLRLEGTFREYFIDEESGLVQAGAGVHLFRLTNATIEAGLGGMENLAGVPASVGGAIVMNAGGTYGEIASLVRSVTIVRRSDPGSVVELSREAIAFGYRSSGLRDSVVVGAAFGLERGEREALKTRQREINDRKRASQPMSACSAGCCFKNPTLDRDVEGIGTRGQRVSAGLVIDRAGLKGLLHGTAHVSTVHANFLLCGEPRTGKARDVIELIEIVRERVRSTFGITLETEVVIWREDEAP